MVRFAQRKETMGIGRQRDQQRQGPVCAVVRSATWDKTPDSVRVRERCGEPCARSTVPGYAHCLYLTTAWLVLLKGVVTMTTTIVGLSD